MNEKTIKDLSLNENTNKETKELFIFVLELLKRIEKLESDLENTKENIYKLYRGPGES